MARIDGLTKKTIHLSHRLFNGSTWGVLPARPFSMSIIAWENRKSIEIASAVFLF
nr:MAG TPA: hypothetical protein [Caudoviricetes sp.]